MDTIAEDTRLPAEIDAQPLVRAAAALQPTIRTYREEIEREQRLPPALVEQMHAAGFYRMVIPRSLGGLQADPLTYTRVVELLAEGAGSVGWNIANNSIGQLVTLGMPDEGVQEIHGQGTPSVIAGTAVQGGGTAVPVEGGYRVTGHWTFGSGCQESSWMLGSFQILDGDQPRRRPNGGSLTGAACFRARRRRAARQMGRRRSARHRQFRLDGESFPAGTSDLAHVGVPLDNQWSRWPGLTYALPSQCWVGPHHSSVITGIARAGIDALIALAVEKTPRGRTGMLCENPQVQDAVGPGGRDFECRAGYRSATITEMWNTIAAGGETTLEQRARCRLASTNAADSARDGDGSGVPAGWQHVVQAGDPAGGMLARPARRRADRDGRAGMVSNRRPGAAGHGSGSRLR